PCSRARLLAAVTQSEQTSRGTEVGVRPRVGCPVSGSISTAVAHRAHMVVRAAQDQHGPVTVSSSGVMGKLLLESRDFGSGKGADIGEHIRDEPVLEQGERQEQFA